jgi:NitT/TauT family transport system substrate-binding protein
MKIGISAPGSSTQFMVQYLMVRNGLAATDASFISLGASSGVVAAVERGEIDAVVNVDPVISLLESKNRIKVVADTRTAEGSRAVYGGDYPAAVLYAPPAFVAKNPRTVQALVDAFVHALQWIKTHSPEEIAAVMPPEYALGDKALYVKAIAASLAMYSPDGKFSRAGAETVFKVLREFDPTLRAATVDLGATYTDAFVDKAPAPK